MTALDESFALTVSLPVISCSTLTSFLFSRVGSPFLTVRPSPRVTRCSPRSPSPPLSAVVLWRISPPMLLFPLPLSSPLLLPSPPPPPSRRYPPQPQRLILPTHCRSTVESHLPTTLILTLLALLTCASQRLYCSEPDQFSSICPNVVHARTARTSASHSKLRDSVFIATTHKPHPIFDLLRVLGGSDRTGDYAPR